MPWRVPAAEELLDGRDIGDVNADQVAEAALADAQPLPDGDSLGFPLAKTLIGRACNWNPVRLPVNTNSILEKLLADYCGVHSWEPNGDSVRILSFLTLIISTNLASPR